MKNPMSFESAKDCRLIAIHRNDNCALNRDSLTINRDFMQDLTDYLPIFSAISLVLLEAHVWVFSLIYSIFYSQDTSRSDCTIWS